MSGFPGSLLPQKLPWQNILEEFFKKKEKDVGAKAMVGVLPKPVLRGHHTRWSIKHLAFGFCLAAVSGVLYKTYYMDPKKKAYADFYKTYDVEADYIRMRDLNLFQSVPPGGYKNKINKS